MNAFDATQPYGYDENRTPYRYDGCHLVAEPRPASRKRSARRAPIIPEHKGPTTRNERLCLALCFLVLAVLLSSKAVSQQSYRSYQQLPGRVLENGPQAQTKTFSRALPMPFMGWNHPGKSGADYRQHFSRPRARAERANLLAKTAAWAARQPNGRPGQFAPSELPGVLLRDSLPAGYIPTSVATGDFNSDGKTDFVVANGGDNNLWLYFGKGDGTFNLPIILPITLGQSPVWVGAADLRGIGRTDLIVAEADSNSVGVFLGNGDGTFSENAAALPGSATSLAIGDFNHDGKLDIAAPLDDGNSSVYISVLPGTGTGTFGSPIATPTFGYAASIISASSADLNGDGIPDLVLIASGFDELAVQAFLSNGDGTFSVGQVVAENNPSDFDFTTLLFDADGDGVVDVLVSDFLGVLTLYHGNGDGTFDTGNPPTFLIGDVGYAMSAADVNGDGHMDVIVSGIYVDDLFAYGTEAGNQFCVLEGDGKGNFGPPKVYRGDSSAYSLAVGDFNGDGHPMWSRPIRTTTALRSFSRTMEKADTERRRETGSDIRRMGR